MALRTRTVSRSRMSMFIGVSVGFNARLRALPAVAAAEYRNPPLGLTLILAFAPVASNGARPPLRSSHCHRFRHSLSSVTIRRQPPIDTQLQKPCWLPSRQDDPNFHFENFRFSY